MVTSRQAAVRVLAGAAALLTLVSCGGEDDPDPAPSGSPPATTEPALTAPPSLTPEEQAEADIQATFEQLIADRDAYYSNAGDYTLEEVATNSPATEWNVTGPAELEMSNWTVLWRQRGLEQAGSTTVAGHAVSAIELAETANQADQATSLACLDMTSLEYVGTDGESVDLDWEPDRFQEWEMTWIHFPSTSPGSGVTKPGWYVRTVQIGRNHPC